MVLLIQPFVSRRSRRRALLKVPNRRIEDVVIKILFLSLSCQDIFKEYPVTLVTAEHTRSGKEYDAALIWTEDATKASFKVCLREMQNFDGKHEEIYVVCSYKSYLLGQTYKRILEISFIFMLIRLGRGTKKCA